MPGDDINSGIFTNLSDLITVMEPHSATAVSPGFTVRSSK